MKILLIHNSYRHHGGEDTCVQNQIRLLNQHGHQVKLFTVSNQSINPHSLSQQLKIALRMFHHPTLDRQLAPVINSFKPDLVHLHNIYPLITPTVYHLLKKHHLPIVQTIHNYNFIQTQLQLSPYRFLLKLSQTWHLNLKHSYQLIDAFIFPNQFTLNLYRQKFNFITNQNSHFLPNFTFPPKTQLNLPRTYYSFIGRLAPEKGLTQFLQVVKTLPQLQFLIVGQGPLEKLVQKTAQQLPNLTFQPFLLPTQLSPFFFKSRFLILPSQWLEVMPMSILEALAHSTPIITPSSPPLQKIITHQFNGFLYSPNTITQLRQTLLYVSHLNSEQYHHLRFNSFQTFKQNYSPSTHLSSLLSIYRQTISRV